jgi:hypothetical protein
MRSKRRTAADRYDTWEAGWEERLRSHLRACGFKNAWDYAKAHPARTYGELAERLFESGSFGVAPVQIERLQVNDTPEAELHRSLRDSLARQLRESLRAFGWREGPYWESSGIEALSAWAAMWSSRLDLAPLKHRLFDAGAPEGWMPADDHDPYLLAVVPDEPPSG